MTRDRVASLRTAVQSYVANCRRHARSPEIIVMDGAREPSAHAALRALAIADLTVRYAGAREKRRFAKALALESAVAPAVIDFALFGDRRCGLFTGANRNGLLLDTVGTLGFATDDDTVARTASAPEADTSVGFSSEYEPREFWFFSDRQTALEAVPATEVDVLSAHEQFLGRSAGTIVPSGSTAEPAAPVLDGCVTMTFPSLVGDSGMGSTRHFLTLDGPSRQRLLTSPEQYASGLRSREVLRAVRRATISDSPFCMTTFFGYDNRQLLPPFFPVERNSDGIFGLTLRRTVEGSRVAFVPSVLLHAPSGSRAFRGDEAWSDHARVRMADVVIASTQVHKAGPADPGGRDVPLAKLGAYLRDLASLRIDEFETFVTAAQQLKNLTLIQALESRLREYGKSPEYWAEDVKKALAILRHAPTRKDYIVPWDLGSRGDAEATRRLARELMAKYGALLEAWPTLVAAAGRLRTRGIRVSAQIGAD